MCHDSHTEAEMDKVWRLGNNESGLEYVEDPPMELLRYNNEKICTLDLDLRQNMDTHKILLGFTSLGKKHLKIGKKVDKGNSAIRDNGKLKYILLLAIVMMPLVVNGSESKEALSEELSTFRTDLLRQISNILNAAMAELQQDIDNKLIESSTALKQDIETKLLESNKALKEDIGIKLVNSNNALKEEMNQMKIDVLKDTHQHCEKKLLQSNKALKEDMDQMKIAVLKDMNLDCEKKLLESSTALKKEMDLKLEKLESDVKVLNNYHGMNTTFDWTILDYNQSKLNKQYLVSNEFYTKGQGYKLRCIVHFESDYLFVGIEFVKSEVLLPVFFHKRTFMIMDQSQRTLKRNIIETHEHTFNSGEEHTWMGEIYGTKINVSATLDGPNYKGVYVVNNEIHFRVILEPLEPLFKHFHSNNGTLLWNIPNYNRTKMESQQWIHRYYESEYFYSAPVMGFRMQSRLQFTSTGFYVALYFLKGPNDDVLPTIFPHMVTFMILDQKNSNGKHLIKTSTLDPKEIGEEKANKRMKQRNCHLIELNYSEFELEPYLVNNAIVMKVIVELL